MKVVLFGKGWIAKKIQSQLEHVVECNLRAEDPKVYDYLKQENPDVVLCCIGRTHGKIDDKEISTIDYLEHEGKLRENINDNLYAPLTLALTCQKLNLYMVYIGTGCIFSGSEIYTEESKPDFFGSSYSTVKGFTDLLMRQLNVLNVRIRMPISSDDSPRNLLTKLKNYKKICSIPNSMTVLDDLIPVLIQAMKQKDTGTLHLVNPGVIEHKEILDMMNIHDYELISYEEQRKLLLSDRSNNHLDTTKLVEKYGPVPNIKDSISKILN